MFVQVIQGKTSDPEALKERMDRWVEELQPGAKGYLGSTAGVAEDGTFVVLARFESEEAAKANSDRPEQGSWWEETASLFDGDVTFHDCSDVKVLEGGGDPDAAGFVQVIQGRSKDKDRQKALEADLLPRIKELRTEVLGALRAWDGDHYTSSVYFASEHTAREGEGKVMPDDIQESFIEWQSLFEDMTYVDLTDPWLISPEEGDDEDG